MKTPISPFAERRPDAGFTAIELIVALTILGLAYALASPLIAGLFDRPGLDRSTSRVIAALSEARSTAIVTSHPVRFTAAGGGWRFAGRSGKVAKGIALGIRAGSRANAPARGITFFADGSATGGWVMLAQGERRALVRVDWLTGAIRSVAR